MIKKTLPRRSERTTDGYICEIRSGPKNVLEFPGEKGELRCCFMMAGRAPNPRRVRIFLAEKGLEVPLKPVDMTALWDIGPMKLPRSIPFQRLPVLELDDGTILTESVAICRYFEELHPEPPLDGRRCSGSGDRGDVEPANGDAPSFAFCGQAFRHTHPAMKEWEVPQVAGIW